MSSRHPNILNINQTQLLIIDMQEPFLREITERDRVVDRCTFLLRSSKILNIPVVATTQYAERMGGLIPEIATLVDGNNYPEDKMTFSCGSTDSILAKLRDNDRRQILICGIETHICVAQSALDLIQHGYQVHVAADAVSSRGMDRHKLGMERMRDSNVIPCCAEQAVFEMLYKAGTDQFKAILGLVKN
jgi:nicotinamidase-related amidase